MYMVEKATNTTKVRKMYDVNFLGNDDDNASIDSAALEEVIILIHNLISSSTEQNELNITYLYSRIFVTIVELIRKMTPTKI